MVEAVAEKGSISQQIGSMAALQFATLKYVLARFTCDCKRQRSCADFPLVSAVKFESPEPADSPSWYRLKSMLCAFRISTMFLGSGPSVILVRLHRNSYALLTCSNMS